MSETDVVNAVVVVGKLALGMLNVVKSTRKVQTPTCPEAVTLSKDASYMITSLTLVAGKVTELEKGFADTVLPAKARAAYLDMVHDLGRHFAAATHSLQSDSNIAVVRAFCHLRLIVQTLKDARDMLPQSVVRATERLVSDFDQRHPPITGSDVAPLTISHAITGKYITLAEDCEHIKARLPDDALIQLAKRPGGAKLLLRRQDKSTNAKPLPINKGQVLISMYDMGPDYYLVDKNRNQPRFRHECHLQSARTDQQKFLWTLMPAGYRLLDTGSDQEQIRSMQPVSCDAFHLLPVARNSNGGQSWMLQPSSDEKNAAFNHGGSEYSQSSIWVMRDWETASRDHLQGADNNGTYVCFSNTTNRRLLVQLRLGGGNAAWGVVRAMSRLILGDIGRVWYTATADDYNGSNEPTVIGNCCKWTADILLFGATAAVVPFVSGATKLKVFPDGRELVIREMADGELSFD